MKRVMLLILLMWSWMAMAQHTCFNFRYISGTRKVSKHGMGMAVDVNPLYNPYIYIRAREGHVLNHWKANLMLTTGRRARTFPIRLTTTTFAIVFSVNMASAGEATGAVARTISTLRNET